MNTITTMAALEKLTIDFSHRLESGMALTGDIDTMFNTIGLMTERAIGVLQLVSNRAMDGDDAILVGAIESALCEVKDISKMVGALQHSVNASGS